MPDALDPLPLLRYLHERGVEHIVIGGFAVTAHGFVRATKDLNTVPRPTDENLKRLAGTLRDLEATILDVGDFSPEETRNAAYAVLWLEPCHSVTQTRSSRCRVRRPRKRAGGAGVPLAVRGAALS